MTTKTLSGILLLLALGLLLSSGAQADVVGRLTLVEGRVDMLKGGQLPATPVKIDDGVQTGDVIRTKSQSKAQITFIDNSTLTVSPESRVGIEAYMFDAAQNKRNAVIQLFQGLALVVVNKVLKSADPDFIVKTHTAVMGVRGTEFGIRLQPNSSTILNCEGVLQVRNIFPEVGQLSRRALKMAYSFGPPGSSNSVLLRDMQGTLVGKGVPPTLPYSITKEDWRAFKHQLTTGLNARTRDQDSGTESSGTPGGDKGQGPGGGENISIFTFSPSVKPATLVEKENPPVIEEPPPPPPPPPPLESYSPNLPPISGDYTMNSFEGHQNATYTGSLSLKNSTVQYTVVTHDPATPGDFVKSSSGSITWTVTGALPRINGTNIYSGPLTVTGTTAGGTVFTFPLQATYANGKLTFDTTGPLTGTYAPISTDINPDFTSPGSSGKVTPGSATITWTSTTAAASTLTQAATIPLAAATPVASPQTTATSLSLANAISAVNTLPPSPIITQVTGPPGPAVAGNPVGPQGSPAASAKGLPVVAGSGPPGLSGGGPPGLSGGGPPGQLKDKIK